MGLKADTAPRASLSRLDNADPAQRIALDHLRVKILATIFRSSLVPTTIGALLLAYLCYPAVPVVNIAIWVVASVAAITVRWRFAVVCLRTPPPDPARALHRFAIASTVVGAIQGALGIFLVPDLDPANQAIVTMTIVCWTSGAYFGSAYPPAYYGFVATSLVPFVVLWLAAGTVASAIVGLLIVLLFVAISGYLRQAHGILIESFFIRHDNDRLVGALDTANRRRATLIELLNHDLRNALGTVALSVATLSARVFEPALNTIVKRADDGLERVQGLLDELDALAELDAGTVVANPERTSLADQGRALERSFAPLAGDKGLQLDIRTADLTVLVDRALLSRVLHNLLGNAVKFTEQGFVRATGEYVDGRLIWRVEDSGPGIPVAERERVFEEFYQLDNPERDPAKGRGLGLAIVKRFVALLGGAVTIADSAHGETGEHGAHGTHGGTVFEVVIPCPLADGAAPVAALTAPRSVALEGEVWVVDDLVDAREAIATLLREQGVTVTVFDAPAAALERAAGRLPSALIVDLRLRAGESGLDLAREFRSRAPGVPVVIVTGEPSNARLNQIRAEGFRIIRKPIQPAELFAWLQDGGNEKR